MKERQEMSQFNRQTEDMELEVKLQKKRQQMQFSRIYAEQTQSKKQQEMLQNLRLTDLEKRGFEKER